MFFFLSIGLFAVFVVNILTGAFGGVQYLGDVGEMLTLLCASAAFVVAILRREAALKDNKR